MHPPRRVAVMLAVAASACDRPARPQPASAADERPSVAPIEPAPVEAPARAAPAPVARPTPVEAPAPARAGAPPVPASPRPCLRAREFERRACEHLRPTLCAGQDPCTLRCDLLSRTAQIDLEACEPDGFVAMRSRILERTRSSASWIGHVSAERFWLLDQPLVTHPFEHVFYDITFAYLEDPGPDGRPAGAVFSLEGSVDSEGGFGFHHALSFEAEITCRVRGVPTCTAPLATRYQWSESEHGHTGARDSEYSAEFGEDDPGAHLLVKVETRSVARGDPAGRMGLVLLKAGKHPYSKLLRRELIALAPAGGAPR